VSGLLAVNTISRRLISFRYGSQTEGGNCVEDALAIGFSQQKISEEGRIGFNTPALFILEAWERNYNTVERMAG
jgi:hypothetical protein